MEPLPFAHGLHRPESSWVALEEHEKVWEEGAGGQPFSEGLPRKAGLSSFAVFRGLLVCEF